MKKQITMQKSPLNPFEWQGEIREIKEGKEEITIIRIIPDPDKKGVISGNWELYGSKVIQEVKEFIYNVVSVSFETIVVVINKLESVFELVLVVEIDSSSK
jgi:hypothetical protein